ncbi:MAG: hypothetical protein HY738_16350 [Bacteroidia bacterium]|nr:hypothetical protein [Bacteroidia bacterium]
MAKWEIDRLNYIKEKPQDFINYWMKYSYARLGQKLDMIREQKQMAFDQKNDLSFKYLYELENLIMELRIRKSDDENWEAPEKKTRKKKNKKQQTKKIQFHKESIENVISEEATEENFQQKNEPEQLSFKF